VRLIAVIAAAAGVALLVASPSSGDSPRPIVDPSLENADGYELIVEYAEQAGIPDDWRDFLLAKAWIESRGNPLKGRGITDGAPSNAQIVSSSSEAAAAGKAYDRQVERGAIVGSVWGRKSWSFGSGGLFAMLPANAVVVAYRGTELQGVAEACTIVVSRSGKASRAIQAGKIFTPAGERPETWAIPGAPATKKAPQTFARRWPPWESLKASQASA